MITQFYNIAEYYKVANIRLPNRMDDFSCFEFSDLKNGVQPNIQAYANNFYELNFDIKSECNFKIDTFSFNSPESQLSVISPRRIQSVEVSGNFTENDNQGFTIFLMQVFFLMLYSFKKIFPF